MQPESFRLVDRVIRGKIKAPVAVRVNAALKIIELGQQSAQQSAGSGERDAILAKLAAALGAQLPRRPVTIEAGQVVDQPRNREDSPMPDASRHSQRAPD